MFATNKDLGIKPPSNYNDNQKERFNARGHVCVVTRVSKKGKRCDVKTITSIEDKANPGSIDHTLDSDLINGEIIPIAKKDLNSQVYSGLVQTPIKISTSKLQVSTSKMKYPKKYKLIINNKSK